MSSRLVTIHQFSYQHEIIGLIPLLESHNINFHFADLETVTIDPLLSQAIGGIRLQVNSNQVNEAREIVDEFLINKAEAELESEIILNNEFYYKTDEEKCKTCNSEDKVYIKQKSFLSKLFGNKQHNYYCKKCANTWKGK